MTIFSYCPERPRENEGLGINEQSKCNKQYKPIVHLTLEKAARTW